jgi:MFS family permease
LDAATLSVVFGVSAAVDMLLFYPAGKVMDRWGRRWVAVPSMLLLGLAHAVLPLTTKVLALGAVAMLMGLGNGMSSGLIMTLGADVSPGVGRAQFLGAWRLCADLGTGSGPLLISAVLSVGSLGAAIVVMAGVGAVAAAVLQRGSTHRPSTRRTRRPLMADRRRRPRALLARTTEAPPRSRLRI